MKRNRILAITFLCALLLFLFFFAKSSKQEIERYSAVQSNRQALSELFGYAFWKDVKQHKNYYSLEDVIKGMRSCEANAKPPLDLNTAEVLRLTNDLQRELYESTVDNNLKRALAFLKQISLKPNMITIQEDQLYYEVVRDGEGSHYVTPVSACFFHYIIKTLDDEVVTSTYEENHPRKVALNTAIPGFSKGVLGMKKGEQRRLYIHPDQAYRKANWIVPPQMLLIVDVEVVAFDD